MKNYLLHAGVFLLLLVVAIGAVRFLGVSTNLIRAVPVLYFFYIALVLIGYGVRKFRKRRRI